VRSTPAKHEGSVRERNLANQLRGGQRAQDSALPLSFEPSEYAGFDDGHELFSAMACCNVDLH
jgi:hypothetical protein